MKIDREKRFLKEAGVLLIVIVMIVSTIAVTANTNNNEKRTVIICEGFEDGVMPPVGWTLTDPDSNWDITTEVFFGEYAAIFFDNTSSKIAHLFSPVVDCSAMTEVYLSFWHKQPSSVKGQDTLSVYVSDNGGVTWSMVADYTGDIKGYIHEQVDLSAFAAGMAEVMVDFIATGGGGDGIYLDEIRLCSGYATEFMGVEVAPLGIAELEIVGDDLVVSNMGSSGKDGIWINLEGIYNIWDCDILNFDQSDFLPPGSSLEITGIGIVDGIPDQIIDKMRQIKVDTDIWELFVKSDATSYLIEAFLDDELLIRWETPADKDEWFPAGIVSDLQQIHYEDYHEVLHKAYRGRNGMLYDEVYKWTSGDGFATYSYYYNGQFMWSKTIDLLSIGSGQLEPVEHPFYVAKLINANFEVFSIKKIKVIKQEVPDTPIIIGPDSGKAGIAYNYNFQTTDPDGDDVFYYIDWGDDTNITQIGPYHSGEEATATHTWEDQGTYEIMVQARDTHHQKSEWESYEVIMPRDRIINTPFFGFLRNHPYLFPILRYILGFQ